MKAIFRADKEKHRAVASCFHNPLIEVDDYVFMDYKKGLGAYLIGTYHDDEWVFVHHCGHTDEITTDLSKNQPCIYACMREGLRVEVEIYTNLLNRPIYKDVWELDLKGDKMDLIAQIDGNKIKSIKILDLDKMGIEVEE